MKTIKVNEVKIHKYPVKSEIEFVGQAKTDAYREVPVAEGKLLLVNNTNPIHYNSYLPSERLQYLKPIIISEIEKIEEIGTWLYDTEQEELYQLEKDELPMSWDRKVLALPEHFSPKHLQAIVDGKIKDGDNVLVECEKLTKQSGRFADGSGFEINDFHTKLNSSNHITLHKLEEKTYTKQELREITHSAYRYGFNGGMEEHGHTYSKQHGSNSFNKWFEDKIK